MRFLAWLGVAATAALLLANPVYAASGDEVTVAVGPHRMEFQSVEVRAQAQASDLRGEMDDAGIRDGQVTSSDVAAWRESETVIPPNPSSGCFDGFELVRIGDQAPTRLAVITVAARGAEGPVTSTAPIWVTDTIAFEYATAKSNAPTIRVRLGQLADLATIGCAFGGGGPYSFNYTWNHDWGRGWRWSGGSSPPESSPGSGSTGSGPSASPADAILSIRSLAGSTIRSDTISPPAARALWDGSAIRADAPNEADLLMQSTVAFRLDGEGASLLGSLQAPAAWIGVSTTGGFLLVGLAALGTEIGRYRLLKALTVLGLFSRFDRDEVLDHERRDRLYQYIKANPGPSFSDLKRELVIGNGTLIHHLRILETQEFVKVVRDGFRTRFYVRGPRVQPETYLTRTQKALLDAIQANPGLTQKELAQFLGLPRESVFYHARKLEAAGKLKVTKEGKWRRYFPPDAVASPTFVRPV